MREPAIGAIVLTMMLRLRPSAASVCVKPWMPSLMQLPTNDLVVDTDRDVNTNTGCPYVFNQPSGSTLCGLVGKTIHINARLRANGPRPLVLIATDTIDISATGIVD